MPWRTKKKSTRFSAVHGTSRYSISVSEFSTALTAVLDPLVEMVSPTAYHTTARTTTVTARQARLVRIVLNESMPVKTVSIPP